MKLARDVLDKQLVDRVGTSCGKVDGIVLTVDADGQAVLTRIESGALTLARRLGPRMERWAAAIARRFGPRHGRVACVEWSKVLAVDVDVKIDLVAEDDPLGAGEVWAREKFIARIPGS